MYVSTIIDISNFIDSKQSTNNLFIVVCILDEIHTILLSSRNVQYCISTVNILRTENNFYYSSSFNEF